MPDSILVHVGCISGPFITTSRPPEWLEHLVQQYFIFNDGNLYILTDRENICYLPQHDKVIPCALEDYYSDKISRFHAVYNHAAQDYWTVVATRFIYLENFLRENDLRHVYHFDNDVLLYFNIAEYHDTFQCLYPELAITPESPKQAAGGFMYIDGYRALTRLTDFFIGELRRHGESGLAKKYGIDIITEMVLIVAYKREYEKRVSYLPTTPFGETSSGFSEFGAIFDSVSWGQFIDGTRHGDPPPFHLPWTYVGRMLMANPNYAVVWKTENGLRYPYFNHNGNLVKFNTLHIHSKNLAAFMSTTNQDTVKRAKGH